MMRTANGARVFISPKHMAQHQDVLPFLEDAVSRITPPEDKIFSKHQIEFDQPIGLAACIKAQPGDEYVWAHRTDRDGICRFVTNRPYELSSSVTVVLFKDERSSKKQLTYRVLTAYIGQIGEKMPDDKSIQSDYELLKSIRYWTEHVLVWGSQEVIPGTVTKTEPAIGYGGFDVS